MRFDLYLAKGKGRGNILDTAALLDQPDETLPLGHLIGVLPQQILDHRKLERMGIVAIICNHARQHHAFLAFVRDGQCCKIAPASGFDFQKASIGTSSRNDRYNHALAPDRWQYVCYIGSLAAIAHIGLRNRKAVYRKISKLHCSSPSPNTAPAPMQIA